MPACAAWSCASHGGRRARGRRRAWPRARRRRRDDERPGALDDRPRLRGARGVGGHARDGRRRGIRQRALRGPQHQRVRRLRPVRRSRCARRAGGACRANWGSRTTPAGFQANGDVILSAVFALEPGADPAVLRAVARGSLAYRKRTQPLSAASAGCVFQNPEPARDRVPAGIPASAGALIDRAGLEGPRHWRRPRLADARQLHRERRHGHALPTSAPSSASVSPRCAGSSASNCGKRYGGWGSSKTTTTH